MTGRRTPPTALLIVLPLLLFSMARCKCGDEAAGPSTPGAPGSAVELYRMLFADLPEAEVKAPAEALPHDLAWVAASPDAEAWRKWAVTQPFAQAIMKTPLFSDLRLSKEWRTIEGLQRRAGQAARLTGDPDDRAGLWAGPTAVGVSHLYGALSNQRRYVLLVKSIDPGTRALVRFAAAFGTLSKSGEEGVSLAHKDVAGTRVHTWRQGGRTISFALFRNLVIAGDDPGFVERAAALAADQPLNEDTGCQDRLPKAAEPGVHLSLRPSPPHAGSLIGLEQVGLSLVADPKAPFVLRRTRADEASPDRVALLKYAPESSFFAVADGGKPSGALLAGVKARLGGKASVGQLDVEKELIGKLSHGMGLIFTGLPEGGAFGGVLVFSHDKQDLEPAVRKVLAGMTGAEIRRTKLASGVKATLLGPEGDGPRAALTDDALLVAMSDETLRAALSAGQAQAPSLKDRKLDLGAGANGAVYLDLESTAQFLGAFTSKHVQDDAEDNVLMPTIAALRTGGRLFGRLQSTEDQVEQGALRVLP